VGERCIGGERKRSDGGKRKGRSVNLGEVDDYECERRSGANGDPGVSFVVFEGLGAIKGAVG